MKEFKRDYDFYDLPEDERKSLVGQFFRETHGRHLYLVVDLHPEQFNYGVKQGVFFIGSIRKEDGRKHFTISAFSPDDLDDCVTFYGESASKRQEIILYMARMVKKNVRYWNVIKELSSLFGGVTYH